MNTTNPGDDIGSARLGGRLPLQRPDNLAADQRRLYDQMQASMVPWAETAGFQAKLGDGRLIGPFNPILFSPALGDAFLVLQDAEQHHTSLDARTRQVVILTVGAVWACDYERYAHAAVAAKTGLSSGAIAELSRGEASDELNPQEKLAQRLTWQLARSHAIEPDLYEQAQRTFDPKSLVDLVFLVGIYGVVCGLLNGFAIPAPWPVR